MNKLNVIVLLVVLLAMSMACSEKTEFSIKGEVEGADAQMIEMIYYANGSIKHEVVSLEDGKFELKGASKSPTLVALTLSGRTPLATVVAENGDELKCKFNIADLLHPQVKGNGPSADISKFVGENAELIDRKDVDALNKSIAEFVGNNRDNLASSALMVAYFYVPGYELLADSLMGLVEPSARPQTVMQNFNALLSSQLSSQARADIKPMSLYERKDTVVRYHPTAQSYSLLAFVSDDRRSRDSIVPRLFELVERYPLRRFKAVEVSLASDSSSWRTSVDGDSAKWWQVWAPGTVASVSLRQLSIPRYPFFIVVDSIGTQLYRGGSITTARKLITDRLH